MLCGKTIGKHKLYWMKVGYINWMVVRKTKYCMLTIIKMLVLGKIKIAVTY